MPVASSIAPTLGEQRSLALQPVVAAAVDLEEHARPRHPLAPAAVASAPSGARQRVAARGQDPPDRPRRDRQVGVTLLGEGLGEVDRVEPGELARREFDQAAADRVVGPVGRRPAAIAVDEGRHPLGPEPMRQPVDLAGREAQDGRSLGHRHLTGEQMGKDVGALLSLAVQADRLPRFHGIEGDKVAVPLARTESLSYDRRAPGA
jgi:hypothetical protein